jgi:hypothetical protein
MSYPLAGSARLRRLVFTIAVALALAPVASSQVALPSPSPRVRLNLPLEIPSETIRIMYFLTGPFGGYGQILRSEKDQTLVDIPVSVAGVPATNLKIAAYLPGCENVTMEIPLEGSSSQQDLRCHPIGVKRLHGRIIHLAELGEASGRVDVTLSTGWICHFFQEADCMTPLIYLARAEVRDGEFTVDLPDLAHPEGVEPERFDLVLVQPHNKRHANLRLAGSAEHSSFSARPYYDAETRFEAKQFEADPQSQ